LSGGNFRLANLFGTTVFKGRPDDFSMAATSSLGDPPGKSRLNFVRAGGAT
jgi:hypothetical protein